MGDGIVRGLSIGGRQGAGKDYLLGVLHAAFPKIRQVGVSRFIQKYIIDHKLTPDGKIDRARDVPLMAQLGEDLCERWAEATRMECELLRTTGFIPAITGMRKPEDDAVATRLAFKKIIVTAPAAVRAERVCRRDGIDYARFMEIEAAKTEGYFDSITWDFTFDNSGQHTAREFGRLFTFLAQR